MHFVHLDDVDRSGHESGFDPYNPDIRAIEGNDVMVALIGAPYLRPNIERGIGSSSGSPITAGRAGTTANRSCPVSSAVCGGQRPAALVEGEVTRYSPDRSAASGLEPQDDWALDGSTSPGPLLNEVRSDGRDDDADGSIDCADEDCQDADACVPIEEVCPGDDAGQRIEWAIYTASMQGAVARLSSSCGGLLGRERTVRWRAPRSGRYTFNTISSRGTRSCGRSRPATAPSGVLILYGDARGRPLQHTEPDSARWTPRRDLHHRA